MFVEIAAATLATRAPSFILAATIEFNELGAARKRDVAATLHERTGIDDPMTAGYLLGLETMRAMGGVA